MINRVSIAIIIIASLGGLSQSTTNPAIRDKPNVNFKDDAQLLRKAMKGFGVNENYISGVVTQRSLNQRLQIKDEYKKLFKKDLIADLKSELSGAYEEFVIALFLQPEELLATTVHNAVHGIGTDEVALNDIFCCVTNKVNVERMATAFKRLFSKDMRKEVKEDVSGDYRKLLEAIMTTTRKVGGVDHAYVATSAAHLKNAGTDMKFRTDEEEFIRIFVTSSYDELREIGKEYRKVSGTMLHEAVKSETSGDFRTLLLQILDYAEDPIRHFAYRVNDMKKNAHAITGFLVSHSEVDLADIRNLYDKMYVNPLEEDVKFASSKKAYKNAATLLVKGNR